MLLEELRKDKDLLPFICNECEENGVFVGISTDVKDIVIISVDKYYNSFNENRPASPDCLIVQYCETGKYHLYIVELKNVAKTSKDYLDRDNIHEKFTTCLQDFMSNRFREYFYNTDYQLDIRLALIAGHISETKIRNFSFDFLLAMPPIIFGNKRYAIKGFNPNPLISKC
jgi:hypothetical protein